MIPHSITVFIELIGMRNEESWSSKSLTQDGGPKILEIRSYRPKRQATELGEEFEDHFK